MKSRKSKKLKKDKEKTEKEEVVKEKDPQTTLNVKIVGQSTPDAST